MKKEEVMQQRKQSNMSKRRSRGKQCARNKQRSREVGVSNAIEDTAQ